ncbi:ATP-binding cassette domain-containing protein [Aeromicrobium fastidiosum]|uniref:ATP-binding cassette domain-containing protein n=1 Tax=Aeromicrobium fastidiosum TaxID=52699 RepID=A0A641AQF0_9ACTN|nr:ATP-binding cassette domain-containing protein [Aeromicrobium fastidiosum]KAA1379747.1 ATP-binding cassette domain-containing protein [Aeromicrobium fastidiosum]MBP2389235.1 ABC-2 type transport system ATP-binding protein [Aeromicrobium fastidiosum]
MALIEAQSLGKTFGNHRAVDDLSFTVRPGSVTGFLGPNGSGKSTTMRLMLGLDRGDGATTFDGVRFGDLDQPMRHVGALLEAKPFHPTRRARNHLRMLAAPNGIPDRRVDEVVEMVGLTDVARGRPGKFSLGMGQRLGIAAALLGDPHTLILDEPSNGLDPQGITWLRNLLKHLAGQGRAVFVSSHLLQEMALLADELVVIGRGRMLANGPVHDFIAHSGLGDVVVRTPDLSALAPRLESLGATLTASGDSLVVRGATAEQIGDAAQAAGARLHQLTTREATLEEAFLEATGLSEEFRGSHTTNDGGQR